MIEKVFEAARTGDAAQLERLLAEAPALANAENADGLTPLGFAAHFGQAEAVRVLLDRGAEVGALSHSTVPYIPANTALHAALAGTRSAEVIALLLERGAPVNLQDSNGHTCLHVAAFHDDNLQLIELLLERGAEPAAESGDGSTALEIAVRQGNANVAALLRERADRA